MKIVLLIRNNPKLTMSICWILVVSRLRDFGATSWSEHITILFILSKSFARLDNNFAGVRSVWTPILQKNIALLENV